MIQQLPDAFARLDVAMGKQLVRLGARFLYTVNGSGKCYEGTLLEISPLGHVKLNASGVWDWPPEVRIEEILSQAAVAGAGAFAAPPPRADAPPLSLPFAKTTKTKR